MVGGTLTLDRRTDDGPIAIDTATLAVALAAVFGLSLLLRAGSGFLPAVVVAPPVVLSLTIVPGALFLVVLGYEFEFDARSLLYAMGCSLMLVMLVGLVLNVGLPMVGYVTPMAPLPVALGLGALVAGLAAVVVRRDGPRTITLPLESFVAPVPLALLCLPLASVLAISVWNRNGLNQPLLLVLTVLAFLPLALVFLVDDRWYPLGIWSMGIAGLYHASLFKYNGFGGNPAGVWTWAARRWTPGVDQVRDTSSELLQNGVLFPIYARLADVPILAQYDVVNPFLVAFVPVALYVAFDAFVPSRTALLGAAVFVAAHPFYIQYPTAGRAATPVLFLALLGVVIADKRALRGEIVAVLGLLFGTGIVVTHYGTSYFVMFAFVFAALLLGAFRVIDRVRGTGAQTSLDWTDRSASSAGAGGAAGDRGVAAGASDGPDDPADASTAGGEQSDSEAAGSAPQSDDSTEPVEAVDELPDEQSEADELPDNPIEPFGPPAEEPGEESGETVASDEQRDDGVEPFEEPGEESGEPVAADELADDSAGATDEGGERAGADEPFVDPLAPFEDADDGSGIEDGPDEARGSNAHLGAQSTAGDDRDGSGDEWDDSGDGWNGSGDDPDGRRTRPLLNWSYVGWYSALAIAWYFYLVGGHKYSVLPNHTYDSIMQLTGEEGGTARSAARIQRDYGSLAIDYSRRLYFLLAGLMGIGLLYAYARRFRRDREPLVDDTYLAIASMLLGFFGMTFVVRNWGGGRPMMIAFSFTAVFAVVGVGVLGALATSAVRRRGWPRLPASDASLLEDRSVLALFALLIAVMVLLNTGVVSATIGGGDAPSSVPLDDDSSYHQDVALHVWLVEHHGGPNAVGDTTTNGQTDWYRPEIVANSRPRGDYSGWKPRGDMGALSSLVNESGPSYGYLLLMSQNYPNGTIERELGKEPLRVPVSTLEPSVEDHSTLYSSGSNAILFRDEDEE